jgi:serine/threonine protein kinase
MLPLTPTKLGRYEIVDEIGKGAMGVVFLARDPLIGRLVALKTFRIGYSVRDVELEQFRARFIREAQSAGILSHPNIVTIHDVVEESEEGLAFIAMEYVRGTNLKSLLQGDQPLSLPFVVDVIAQVADALDYAHSHRVIHRDVKPANILITADNRVKITDFGIARLDTSNLTQEGQLLGTPNYMAPEQIQGKDVDHRADLFALGVVLYEMLTRHKPFQGENLTVVSHRIVYDHFTPPREFGREMPPGIEPVLNRALDKDPARRYQRAKEMVDDLRRVGGTVGSEDLNETQSLAMIAPILTPPPPLADITGTLPPLPATAPPAAPPAQLAKAARSPKPAKLPKPPRPPRSGPLVSGRRLAVAGGSSALLLLLIGAALLLWLSWSTPTRDRDPKQDSAQSDFLVLVRMGDQLMRAGSPAQAAQVYRQAEGLAPERSAGRVRALRQAAELQAQASGQLQGVEVDKAARLLEARTALDARRWDDAVTAANAVLTIDPLNPEAQQILAGAQSAQQSRAREQRAAASPRTQRRGPSELTPLQPSFEPAPTTQTAAPEPVARTYSLAVNFVTELPGAFVMVSANGRKIFQGSAGDRGGFFRRSRGSARTGGNFPLEAGPVDVKVWVTPPGKAAILKTLHNNFPGGGTRHLEIHLSEAQQATASLQ